MKLEELGNELLQDQQDGQTTNVAGKKSALCAPESVSPNGEQSIGESSSDWPDVLQRDSGLTFGRARLR